MLYFIKYLLTYFFYEFPQVIGAKVINLTLTIKNNECNEDDQSFWQKLKEAVTDNTLCNYIYLFIYLVS